MEVLWKVTIIVRFCIILPIGVIYHFHHHIFSYVISSSNYAIPKCISMIHVKYEVHMSKCEYFCNVTRFLCFILNPLYHRVANLQHTQKSIAFALYVLKYNFICCSLFPTHRLMHLVHWNSQPKIILS